MSVLIVLTLAFVGLSGAMALIEAAVISVSRAEVEEMAASGVWGSRALRAIATRLTPALVLIVIVTNTINILGPILVGRRALSLWGDAAIAPVTLVLAAATIVFSEIIPKSLGAHHAPLISRLAAPGIRIGTIALHPLVAALEWFANLFKTGDRRIGTEAQIRSLATIGRRAGHILDHEGQLIRRSFILNDRSAGDVMTPLAAVVSVAAGDTVSRAARKVFHHAFSRYPVFGESPDEIVGLALSRDILEALVNGRDDDPVDGICQRVPVVPTTMSLDTLLARFRDERIHLAVVQDHHHHTVGLVTLEDVLEELVGDIEDEKD